MRWLFLFLLSLPLAAEIYEGHNGYWLEVVATAYSPHDPIDGAYRATKGKWRWITADGRTDVRSTPYGIAVPLRNGTNRPHFPFVTKVIIPVGFGYVDQTRPNRIFKIDDVGNGKEYFKSDGGRLHIDVRFKTHYSAIKWAGPTGRRIIKVFIITP